MDHTLRTTRIVRAERAGPPSTHVLAPSVAGRPDRAVYDAQRRMNQNASRLVLAEGDAPPRDPAVGEAYEGLGATYRFFWEVCRRKSIDDAGMPLVAEVHFGDGYDNAFWDGERMLFGDGDGRLFAGFTRSIDVVGHELTHGVTQATIGLDYLGESGALNESISDVFGCLVKQYHLQQTVDQADWLHGAGVLGPGMPGQGIRSLKAPGTAHDGDSQPANMKDYVTTTGDNGGVHINSGIPNHAFYLAATALGGHAWERTGRIWYQTLTDQRVPSNCHFHAFAQATVNNAEYLFGRGSTEAKAVADAWAQVGVLGDDGAASMSPAPSAGDGGTPHGESH